MGQKMGLELRRVGNRGGWWCEGGGRNRGRELIILTSNLRSAITTIGFLHSFQDLKRKVW